MKKQDKKILETTHISVFHQIESKFLSSILRQRDVVYNYALYFLNINNALFNNTKITSVP